MSLLISTLKADGPFGGFPSRVPLVPENPPRIREAHVKSPPGYASGLQVWEREGPRDSMSDNRGHWAWEFAMQRRSQLFVYARRWCGNASDADDLVQEIIVRFKQAADNGMVPSEARQCEVWLARTLRNRFIDLCRRRAVQQQGAGEQDLGEEAAAPQELPGDSIYDSIAAEHLSQALDKLSPKLRETLKLHLEGKKYHEIAELLGVPIGTVGKRIHDARERLHELLKPYMPDPGDDQ